MKLGLALSGGSLRGAAHLGVLEVLLQNGIKPDLLAGTSAGALVAALYAAGMTPLQQRNLLLHSGRELWDYSEEGWPNLKGATRWKLPQLPMGLLHGRVIETLLTRLLGPKSFAQLDPPVAVCTTDINTGEEVVFASHPPQVEPPPGMIWLLEGTVSQALRASIAIPGVLSPYQVKGRLLVDGGVVNNVPADVLKHLGADKVLAVDLGFAVKQDHPITNVLEVLLQTSDIMGQRISDLVTARSADLVLRPATGEVRLWDLKKVPALYQAGLDEARKHLTEIRALLM